MAMIEATVLVATNNPMTLLIISFMHLGVFLGMKETWVSVHPLSSGICSILPVLLFSPPLSTMCTIPLLNARFLIEPNKGSLNGAWWNLVRICFFGNPIIQQRLRARLLFLSTFSKSTFTVSDFIAIGELSRCLLLCTNAQNTWCFNAFQTEFSNWPDALSPSVKL